MPRVGRPTWAGDVPTMSAHSLQWSRSALPVLVHPHELAALVRMARTLARIGALTAATAGFAGVMWLLLAGPGLLDGRSSTVDHAASRSISRHAAR